MFIDSSKLKQTLEKQKVPESKDTAGVVERCYNKGLQTAIEIIKFYEEDANRSMRDYKPLQEGFIPDKR